MTRLCIIGALICCAALAALPVLADTATLSGKTTITLPVQAYRKQPAPHPGVMDTGDFA